MEVARKLFYEKGYYRTTMDDIAKEAGVAKGTVYLYFNSKVELLLTIIETEHVNLLDFLQNLTKRKDLDPREKLSRFIDRMWDILYSARHMLAMSEIAQRRIIFEEGFKDMYMTRVMPLRKAIIMNLKSIFEEGVKKGQFRPVNSEFAVRWMIFSIPGAFYGAEGRVRYEDKETVKDLIFNGFSKK